MTQKLKNNTNISKKIYKIIIKFLPLIVLVLILIISICLYKIYRNRENIKDEKNISSPENKKNIQKISAYGHNLFCFIASILNILKYTDNLLPYINKNYIKNKTTKKIIKTIDNSIKKLDSRNLIFSEYEKLCNILVESGIEGFCYDLDKNKIRKYRFSQCITILMSFLDILLLNNVEIYKINTPKLNRIKSTGNNQIFIELFKLKLCKNLRNILLSKDSKVPTIHQSITILDKPDFLFLYVNLDHNSFDFYDLFFNTLKINDTEYKLESMIVHKNNNHFYSIIKDGNIFFEFDKKIEEFNFENFLKNLVDIKLSALILKKFT